MGDEQLSQADLAQKILDTAREEADGTLSEARTAVAQRQKALDSRVESIHREADERVDTQLKIITGRADAAIVSMKTRSRLRTEKRIYREVEQLAAAAIREMRGEPGYDDVIRRWIIEAVEGVDAEEATVLCPKDDRATVEKVLDAAAKELSRIRGTTVKLSVDEGTALVGQGVVVRDSTGRIAFSNLVADRIRRHAGEIRKAAHRTVFGEKNDG